MLSIRITGQYSRLIAGDLISTIETASLKNASNPTGYKNQNKDGSVVEILTITASLISIIAAILNAMRKREIKKFVIEVIQDREIKLRIDHEGDDLNKEQIQLLEKEQCSIKLKIED